MPLLPSWPNIANFQNDHLSLPISHLYTLVTPSPFLFPSPTSISYCYGDVHTRSRDEDFRLISRFASGAVWSDGLTSGTWPDCRDEVKLEDGGGVPAVVTADLIVFGFFNCPSQLSPQPLSCMGLPQLWYIRGLCRWWVLMVPWCALPWHNRTSVSPIDNLRENPNSSESSIRWRPF